jgi:hypothetical protein
MSYLFFARSSLPGGTRADWLDGEASDGGQPRLGLVGGQQAPVAQSLFDLPATEAIGTATARYALGSLQAGAPDALAQASAAGSQVFTAGAPEAPNPVFSALAASAGQVVVALADTDWNAVKNLELLVDSATLAAGFEGVELRNLVDVRVKLGTEEATAPAGTEYRVGIANAKRGQLDYTQADAAVATTLSLATNGSKWQNSFTVDGSRFADRFTLAMGDHTGLGGTGETVITDGSLTLVSAAMGAGDDLFNGSAVLADTNVTLGQDQGVLTLGVTNVTTPGFSVAGGDRAVLGDGADALFYSVASADGVDTIEGFTLGQDTLSIALGGQAVSVLELGRDTLLLFAGYAGAVVLRGVTGAALGTDLLFS